MKKKTRAESLRDPESRNPMVIELLRDPDPEAQRAGLDDVAGRLDDELAGELTRILAAGCDPEFGREILELLAAELDTGVAAEDPGDDDDLDDPDDDEDAFFLTALTRRGLGRLQEFLQTFYRDAARPALLRRKALEAAASAPAVSPEAAGRLEAWLEEAVREAWARPEPEWRVSALFAMAQLFPVDFTEEIQEGLASPVDAVRAEAIAAADARDLTELGPAILAIAGDAAGEIEVRLCAIEALANLRPRGARSLLERLRGGPEPFAHFAADALDHLEQNARAAALLAEAADPGDWGARPEAPGGGRGRLFGSRFL